MPIFKRRRPESKSAGDVSFSSRYVEVIRGFDGALGSYADLYRKLAPVRTVVDFLADAVSTTPLKVYERTPKGRPELYDHPLAVLLRHPNPETSPRALIANTVKDLAVYGNAFWWKVVPPDGANLYLVPVPPSRMRPGGGGMLAPAYYDLWPVSFGGGSAVPRRIPREDIVHFRFYDPEDRRAGTSKLEALRTILAEEVEVSKHRQRFWRNAARQDLVLERPETDVPWDDDDRKRFRESWRAAMSGTANAGETAILEDGMTARAIAFSAKDSEFIEGRRFVLEAVARTYNIPVSLLSLTETSTYASQREFHAQLYRDTLPPWFELIQSEIELQLLPDFETDPDPATYVEFNVEAKLRGSFEEQAQVLSTAIGRPWMTVEEGRSRTNLPDRGDPTDAELAIPVNNVSLGAPAQPAPAAALPGQASAADLLALKRVIDDESRALLERVGRGEPFDLERWNAKLAAVAGANERDSDG